MFLGKIKAIGENIVDTTFAFLGNECIGFANILIFSTTNLFVTSKNEFSNSPIPEFKVLQNVFKIKKTRLKMFLK